MSSTTLAFIYFYMKLIFVKNLKKSKICEEIFNYLIVINKNNTLSFIKDFNITCNRLKLNYILKNLKNII